MKVIHFYNGLGGGVQTVLSYLINYVSSEKIESQLIYIIEKSRISNIQKVPLSDKIQEKYFIYDSDWNFYFIIKKLRSLIDDECAILITHDWLELGMVSQLTINNPVLSFLHGNYEYYYDLFTKHSNNVNLFLSVTDALRQKIITKQTSLTSKIQQYSYPVQDYEYKKKCFNTFKILFIASNLNDANKNFKILPKIDSCLLDNNLNVEWHIVGKGLEDVSIEKLFSSGKNRVKYYGRIMNHNLSAIYNQANIFINCSCNEGLPVSLIEAMKNGLIPIVSSWNGSALDIIANGVNGYVVEDNTPDAFSNVILRIKNSHAKLTSLSTNSFTTASKKHSLMTQIAEFEDILFELRNYNKKQVLTKVYGSRLDNPMIPNFVTTSLRKLKGKISG